MVPDQLAAQIGKSRFTLPVPFLKCDDFPEFTQGDYSFGDDWKDVSVQYKLSGKKAKSQPVLLGWRLRKVKAYIEENLEERISTQDMADLVGLSAGYFCPAFKNTVGLKPQAYIMGKRLIRARNLLTDASSLALNEIAFSCGFTDQAHLNNRFKAAFGISPGMWRKLHHHTNDPLAAMTCAVAS